MRYPFRAKTKPGFTLIELLVVIAILAILFALVTSGVMKIMENIPKTQTVNEINQLTMAMETFKNKYGMYPPSRIFLSNNPADFAGAGLPTASKQYLSFLFPRINWGSGLLNWAGYKDGTTTARSLPAGGVILEGDQCLVYFLNGPWGTGWSTNPTNPTDSTRTTGPFYEFPHNTAGSSSNRLAYIAHPSQGALAAADFESFIDPYGTPTAKFNVYAFFSSGRSKLAPGSLDCQSLGISPYVQSNGRCYKENSVQIISAGKNYLFGPGGTWPNTGAAYLPGGAGVDDMSNFSGDLLGVF